LTTLLSQPLLFYQDANGKPLPGALCNVYLSGTNTPAVVYRDAARQNAFTNPIPALTNGYFPAIYVPDDITLKLILTDASGANPLPPIDPVVSNLITQAQIGGVLNPITAAETSTGVTPVSYAVPPTDIDVSRYGIIPNDNSSAGLNSSTFKTLVDSKKTGPVGRLLFPTVTGADTYFFNDFIEVRDNVHMDLCGSTLQFEKAFVPTDTQCAPFKFIRNVTIENGTIILKYDGTGAADAGPVLLIGSRLGVKFGTATTGIQEETLTTPMGNIVLRNLRIVTNNPATVAVIMLGGLRNVRVENVTIEGGGVTPGGIYYEFGDYHYESTVANRKTAHASGLYFGNVTIKNCNPAVTGSNNSALTIVGASDALIENLTIDGADVGLSFRPGEALYFNPGPDDSGLVKRCITVKNVRIKNVSSGISLVGAESKANGYLHAEALAEFQQTELMRFSVDGGVVSGSGLGIFVSGPCDIRNVTFNGAASGGQIVISDECIRGTFTNCEIRGSAGIGVRANFGDHLWATPRLKTLQFINCQVSGNAATGYSFGHTQSVEIHGGRIGYQLALDGQAESAQTVGVNVDQTSLGGGVYCYGVDVATSGGVAYSITGAINNPCGVFHPKGTVTFTGNWDRDGVGQADSTNFTDKTAFLNVAGKYAGRLAYNTTDNKLYMATGATDVSTWKVADASATITPA